jgi:hypothetical protein
MTTVSRDRATTWFTQPMQVTLTAVALVAYAAHSAAWIGREINGGTTWPPLLESAYVGALVLWIGALLVIQVGRLHRRRTVPAAVLQDERTRLQFIEAHRTALVVVLLAQVPFFVLDVPTRVLAQFTVTTSVVALAAAYAWHDR